MAVFRWLTVDKIPWEVFDCIGDVIDVEWITAGTDNSVFKLLTIQGESFIYKIYEGKDEVFLKFLLSVHQRIKDILTHDPIAIVRDFVSWNFAIIFPYIESDWEVIPSQVSYYIPIFHDKINKWRNNKTHNWLVFFETIKSEVLFFAENIKPHWYISAYPGIDIASLVKDFLLYLEQLKSFENELSTWLIHNDLNKWNIIFWKNGIEFIDFDWVNRNLLIKDYIVFIIRFWLIDNLEKLFEIDNEDNFKFWNDVIKLDLVILLYKIYSIYLILNMIYYIWYDEKDVHEWLYWWDNQPWQEIYMNLNKI